MTAYKLLKWLDNYIFGLQKNGVEVPIELYEIRKKLDELTYFDDHA